MYLIETRYQLATTTGRLVLFLHWTYCFKPSNDLIDCTNFEVIYVEVNVCDVIYDMFSSNFCGINSKSH